MLSVFTGIDATHNPEFSICEFYEVGATLEDLISRTERLFRELTAVLAFERSRQFPSITLPSLHFEAPFARLPFIPTIEEAINRPLPDLSSTTAVADLIAIFVERSIPTPPNATLPRLLDVLSKQYIEPRCSQPTFITDYPEALSPLSKSYLDAMSRQRVAARVELFVGGRELVNAYEEENCPFEQRRKFENQLRHQESSSNVSRSRDRGDIDESYLEAMQWGMPPTGGWGCGIDRLVMLFAGSNRIAEVLPFGTLRNVVSIAKKE